MTRRTLDPALTPWLVDDRLKKVPAHLWPESWLGLTDYPLEVWLSGDFLVQVYLARDGAQRVTVCRSHEKAAGEWADRITWDELQRVKREIGRGSAWAVEVFPDDAEVTNVANMRHLWLLPEAPSFAWRKRPPASRTAAGQRAESTYVRSDRCICSDPRPHFVPPSCGEPGFYACHPQAHPRGER